MDKREAVKELLVKGKIPTPELIEKMISSKSQNLPVKTKPILEKAVSGEPVKLVDVKITKPKIKEKLSTEDFTTYNNNKYDGLRKIISSKVDAISINKAMGMFGEVGVIGIVKEKTPTGYVVEDTTGSINIVLNDYGIGPGDVIGITGQAKENKLFVKNIILPDIPLTQKYNLLDGVKLTLSRKKTNRPGDSANICLNTEGLSNGSRLVLSNKGSLNILFYSPKSKIGAQECVESLKKRHLVVSSKEIISPKDEFIIEEVPDILWANSDTKFTESYKGVVIISPGKEEINIDLGTKKVY